MFLIMLYFWFYNLFIFCFLQRALAHQQQYATGMTFLSSLPSLHEYLFKSWLWGSPLD